MPQDRASRVGRGISRVWLGKAVEDDSIMFAIDTAAQPDRVPAWALRARGLAMALGNTSLAVADYRSYLALAPDAGDRTIVENWIAQLS